MQNNMYVNFFENKLSKNRNGKVDKIVRGGV